MKPLKDMTGKKFGEWTVLKRGPNTKQGQAQWICICSKCDKPKVVKGSHLREGRSTKCKECHNRTFNLRHGKYKSSTYRIWEAMCQRCHNERSNNFHRYGGRGITVCKEWREDFMNFWAEMGDRPKNLSLDRIDNNKGYCKRNCKWATSQEQMSNRRTSRRPGDIFGSWKLTERTPYSRKGLFECINCGREWSSEVYYVTSGRASNCNCT